MMESQDNRITLNEMAYTRLKSAMKEGEDFSDVIIRMTETKLAGLQRRGEKEIITSDERKLVVKIEQDNCLAAESCVSLAPTVFALPEGLAEVMDVEDRTVDSETVILAAKSCPYHAIRVKDGTTGEEIVSIL